MLVINLNPRERVRVSLPDGRFAWVGLSRIQRGRARIAFEFPQDCQIVRENQLEDPNRVDDSGTVSPPEE